MLLFLLILTLKILLLCFEQYLNDDQSAEINHNPNWPYISDHPCRLLIIGGSGSGKTHVLLNLIKHH